MRTKMCVITAMFVLAIMAQTDIAFGQSKVTDLMRYALDHSREIKKANLQVEEAGYLRKETIGQGLPQVEASGTYSKMKIPEISLPGSITANIPEEYAPMLSQLSNIDALYALTAGAQVTQLIFSQSYWVGLETAKKTQEFYQLLLSKTEEDVIEEVANTYYQTFSLMLQLKSVDKSLVNLREMYRIVDLNYKDGLTKESNVSRLKVTITNLEVSQQTISNIVANQINYLKALAGMPADTVISIDTTLANNNVPALEINKAFSVENVAAYQVLLKQDEISNQQIRLAAAKYYPTIAAFGQFNWSSYNTTSEINKMNNMTTLGAKVSIPIFASGVNNSKVKQAKLRKLQTEEIVLKTKDMLTVGYSNALSEYQSAYNLIDVQNENRNLALKVYGQTTSQYREGIASMTDVLNVNSDFLQADISFNQQLLKCKLAEIKLLKTMGSLKQLVNN